MCGIAGVLKVHRGKEPPPHHEAIPESWLDILDDSIKHRGPDDTGRFRDRATRPDGAVVDVALVHRRLSIIDHAGGAQPMAHVRHLDGSREIIRATEAGAIDAIHLPPDTDLIAVAFNGCIYNHRDLRAELEALGHRFVTDHADTEVLIHGWRAWGPAMRDKLDGMYAALIWDRNAGQLTTARDDCGEKPLYESQVGSTHALASTPHGLARLYIRFDEGGETFAGRDLTQWLAWGASPHMGPIYEITPSVWSQKGYRRALDHQHPPKRWPKRSVRRGAGGLPDLIEAAVTSRLEADVPLGVFLSGGVDSALIAAIAKRQLPDLKTFTVRMPHAAYDESEDAAETARILGTDHHTLDCDANPAEDLVHLIEQLGLPFGDSSLLPTYWVAKAAREHVKVALSGDGADELFGGYRRHTINTALNRWRRVLRLIPDAPVDQRNPGSRSTYLARLAVAARHSGYTELLSIFPTPDLHRLIIDEHLPATFTNVNDPLRHDFESYLPLDLLRKTDTASMAVALEVRAPFLARELVDAARRTPLRTLMPRGERKGLLKQIARGYLPDHVVDRPKRGFAIPIGEWFRTGHGGMRTLLHDHLESADPFPGLADAGVEIDMAYVRTLLHEHDAAGERSAIPWRGRDHSQRLYMLLVLSIWATWLAGLRKNPRARAAEIGQM